MNEDSIWIMSRKISLKSMARHFAAWKLRHFVLDRTNALLGFRTKTSSSTTLIHLNSESVSVRHHYYSNDQKFCLSLTYSEAVNGVTAEREMVMKFESLEKMNKWNKALSDILNENRKVFTAKTKLYFDTFSEYVREQVNLQHILGRDRVLNSFDSPEAFTNDAASSAPVEGFSSQQTAVSVDHNTSNTTNVGNDEASQEISSSPTERPFTLLTAASRSISATNTHSNAMVRSGAGCGFWQIPVPKMRILIMAVGTRGDMQPFVQLGLRLQKDGHRVRVATHAPFREYVTGKGLEFYPLAGDPAKLSEFMVKTHGFIIPTTAEQIREVPAHHSMVVDIMYSCWNACIDPDPEDDMMRPFVADAIISNPITYAHIHCAEALGVPLHLMFPQPWIPTKAFPHPLSCLSYQQGWCSENYISYQVIDRMLWMSFESNINAFRKTVLGLEPIRVGEGGWNMINLNKVPFVKMWSPTLVPKPKDWPEYVDVVGTFFESTEINKPAEKNSGSGGVSGSDSRNNSNSNSGSDNSSNSNSNGNTSGNNSSTHTVLESPEYSPSPELLSFLTSDVPIVFIGFGSMVIHDIEALIRLFLEAAALAGVRVLIQMGWSSISPARFRELALEAEVKTALVRKTEFMNRNLLDSVIFPSEKKANSSGAARNGHTNNSNNTNNNIRKRSTPEKHSSAAIEATIHAIHPPSATIVASGSYSSNHSSPDEKGVLRPEEENSDSEYLVNMGLLDSPPRPSRNNKSLKHNKVSTTSSGAGGEFEMSLDSHSSSYENIPAVAAGSDVTGSGATTGSGNSNSNVSQSPSPSIPAAPSNMLTGWFYTALTTFVAPKREETTPKNSTKNVGDTIFSNTATAASGATTTNNANTATTTTGTNAAKDTTTHATSHPSLSSQSEDEMSAWERAEGGTVWTAEQDAFFLGPCPHSWLFKKVDAVVHHGGAGTTAAGLRYGCPTWICPFFGDQFFWGELVHRGGLGPRPTPVDSLTLDIVAESLAALRSDAMLHAASEISKVLAVEDGVEGAVEAFYRHLPIENMICDVSMFAGESRLAQVFCKDCGFKMCTEVSDLIHCSKELGGTKSHHTLTPCAYMNWSVPRPVSAADGLVQGLGGLVHELAEGVSDVLYDPVKGIYAEGLNGGVVGIVTGVHSLLSRPLRGGNLLVNRVSAGVRNSLGFQDSDSPLRTADGGSLTGMVYGADRHSSDHNKNIRRLRINSIDHPSSGSENSSGHSLKDVQAAAAHEKTEMQSGKVKVFDLSHSTHSAATTESDKMGTFSPTADSLGTKTKAPFLPLRSISEGANSTAVSTTDGVLQIRSLIEGEISKVKTDSRNKPPSHHTSNSHRVRTDSNTSSVGSGSATSGGFYDSLCYSSDEDGDNPAPTMHDLLEGEGEDDNDSADDDLHGLDRGLNTDLNHRHSSSDTNRDESASPLLFPQYSDYSADPAAGDSAPEWQQQRHARRHSQRARGVSEDSSSINAAFLLPQTPEHINYTHSDANSDPVGDNLFEASAVQSSATQQTELSELQEATSPIVSKDTLSAQLRALAVEDLKSSESHKVVPHVITPAMHTATLPAESTANIGAASESALGSHLHSTRLSADHPVIVAYEQAVVVQRMFELLGAKNSRFMSLEVFAQTLTRAVVRKAATSSEEEGSADMLSGGGGGSGKRGSDILNHATVLSLIKSLSRNKKYLDIVDFILLYQEIVQGGLQWTHEPQHIVTTRM